jgi:hypothetical protein
LVQKIAAAVVASKAENPYKAQAKGFDKKRTCCFAGKVQPSRLSEEHH